MGSDDYSEQPDLDEFEDLGMCPPYSLAAHEIDEQRDLSRRWIEAYPQGIEEVNIWELCEGLNHSQIAEIAQATLALMLTSFCRGRCAECGLKAEPYSVKNNKAFALGPLIEFLDEFRLGGLSRKLMLRTLWIILIFYSF